MTKRAWLIVDKDGEPIRDRISIRSVYPDRRGAEAQIARWSDVNPEWRAVQITWRWTRGS
jgi:hypothetical protein